MYKSTNEIGRIAQRVLNRFELLLQSINNYEPLNLTTMNTRAHTVTSNRKGFKDLLSVRPTIANTNTPTNNTNLTNNTTATTMTTPSISGNNLSWISMEIDPIDTSSTILSGWMMIHTLSKVYGYLDRGLEF